MESKPLNMERKHGGSQYCLNVSLVYSITAPPSLPAADLPRYAGRSPLRARLTVIVRGLASPRRRLNPTRLVVRFRVPDSRGSSATSPAARPCSGGLMQHPHEKDDREHAVAASGEPG
ncbi:hypothetical protein [Oryza sativa Japonica Group]|uniref:Uncharacterized protein n=1 Tax=Oryza sativa subsp. japonica TaxID=39947 RepID=Q941S4_ORYSJ|nr:hypothetical protein [Oryza sativa Japonica Group]